MWSVKKAAKTFLILLIAAYALKLLGGRVILYWQYWGDYAEQHSSYRAQLSKCIEDDETWHKFPRECERARTALDTQSPWMSSMAKTLSETHSCVEYPCTDILHDILQKTWVGVISLSILLLIFFFYAFSFVRNALTFRTEYVVRDKKKDDDVDMFLSPATTREDVNLLEQHRNPSGWVPQNRRGPLTSNWYKNKCELPQSLDGGQRLLAEAPLNDEYHHQQHQQQQQQQYWYDRDR